MGVNKTKPPAKYFEKIIEADAPSRHHEVVGSSFEMSPCHWTIIPFVDIDIREMRPRVEVGFDYYCSHIVVSTKSCTITQRAQGHVQK